MPYQHSNPGLTSDTGNVANNEDPFAGKSHIAISPVQSAGRTCNTFSKPVASCCNVANIRPQDYKPLDYPDRQENCHVCGRRKVDYIEKLTG
ncbi:MAG: hypothetical protein WCK53_11510, partial [Methanomicrobiales archaeon]